MEMDKIVIGGYLPTSFLDWNGHVTAVIFTTGCNFRCPYCHNSTLVKSETDPLNLEKVYNDIKRRAIFLDGLTISGGEPCLWTHLIPVIRKVKELGLEIKLDTNGSFNNVLEQILNEGLVDHIAMDVKAPLNNQALQRVTRSKITATIIRTSIEMIKSKAKSYEFRTTFSPSYLSEEELKQIRIDLDDDEHWFVQCFKPNNCLDSSYLKEKAVEESYVQKIIPGIKIRG